jgi:hypothetical protein
MIEPIGESTVRTTMRTESNVAVENRDVALERIEKVVEERPIEASAKESASPETEDKKQQEKKSSGYNMDDNGIFFEKYDRKGNVVFRTPPEEKPIDEHV